MRLPTVIIHHEEPSEFLPLLLEARENYIDGRYFSTVAASVTAADLICIRLADRYSADKAFLMRLVAMTFGQKVEPLRARHIISEDQDALLRRLNRIRNRTLHPQRRLSQAQIKRDAFRAVVLLHELLEGTFSVFRHYTIEQGRLVPKPLY